MLRVVDLAEKASDFIFWFDGESLASDSQAKALHSVQAKGVVSQAYSYYRPEWKRQTLTKGMRVDAGRPSK